MRKYTFIIYTVAMLFMVACNSRKSQSDVFQGCHLHHQTDVADRIHQHLRV